MKYSPYVKRVLCCAIAILLLPISTACSVLTFANNPDKALVINEVVSSNKQSLVDAVIGTPDWIELYNGSSADIDLSGYGLSDNMKDFHKFTFPKGTTIGAGEYLIIYAADDPGEVTGDWLCAGFGLSKSGDYLFLTDGYYNLLQQMEIPYLITDVSYARRSDGSYGYCASTTPGAANTNEIQSVLTGMFADQDLSSLTISEVMPNNPDGSSWVELHNTGTKAVRLENYYLSDTENSPMRWQLPAGTVEAGAYALVYLSGDELNTDGIHAPFKLGSTDDCILLTDLTGTLLKKLTWQLGIPNGVSVLTNTDDQTINYCAFPTPNAENSDEVFHSINLTEMDTADPVRINEVLLHNKYSVIDEDGERSEWVEVYNASGMAISLHGYFLSDDPENLYKWAFPDITLDAGGYQVVFLSGKDKTEGELHASFGLSAGEDQLYLMNVNGMRVDSILLSGVIGDNMSVGRDTGGALRYYAQPTPGSKNAYGFETADSIGFFNKQDVFISEVSAVSQVKDGKLDWIELHNGSDSDVNLAGWYLSDQTDNPTLWQIPEQVIPAKGYVVIETTSRASKQTAATATFGISPSGETLLLSNASGEIVDRFETGSLAAGLSSGRIETDATIARVFFNKATKGEKNSSDCSVGYASQPAFSNTELYHTEAFALTLRCVGNKDCNIYYTLDGSTPTMNAKRYSEPITVSQNTVVRAVAYQDGLLPSEVTTYTYLFDEKHDISVVCVNMDPDKVKKIYNAMSSKDKIEYAGTISFYEKDGELGVTFNAGIKPKGAGTIVYKQKSLAIHLRASYGQSSVTYPFFTDIDLTTFSSLVLRNSGQDHDEARIRDSFFSRVAQGIHLDAAATRPVALYVNGNYYGLYDFNEDLNKDYLVGHYGVDADSVDTIRRNSYALDGTNDDFLRVREFALNRNLADDAVFAEFCQWIDVDYFTDYLITQTYFVNSDMFNQKYWRSQDYTVKWRPIYYDLDFGLTTSTRDMIAQYFNESGVPSADGSLTYMDIYIGLRKNAAWRQMAAQRYVELICTHFAPERLLGILDAMAAEIDTEMPRHIKRWGVPSSYNKWKSEIDLMRTVIERRPENALKQMKKFFGVSQTQIDEWVAQYTAG